MEERSLEDTEEQREQITPCTLALAGSRKYVFLYLISVTAYLSAFSLTGAILSIPS